MAVEGPCQSGFRLGQALSGAPPGYEVTIVTVSVMAATVRHIVSDFIVFRVPENVGIDLQEQKLDFVQSFYNKITTEFICIETVCNIVSFSLICVKG